MPFSPRVEAWRPLAEAFSDDAPTDFLLAWIGPESGGNRCNLTTSAGFREVGLFQLDPDNARAAGVDQDALRVNCDGQVDRGTDQDRIFAMASGVEYIKYLKGTTHKKLQAVGVDWDESTADFWSLLRLQFAAGTGAVTTWLTQVAQKLGRGPASWDEFVANGPRGTQRFDHWTQVSATNGQYGAGYKGGGRGLTRGEVIMVVAASFLGLYAAGRFTRWLAVGQPV